MKQKKATQVWFGENPPEEILRRMRSLVSVADEYVLISENNYVDCENWISLDRYIEEMCDNNKAIADFWPTTPREPVYWRKDIVRLHFLSKNENVLSADCDVDFFMFPVLEDALYVDASYRNHPDHRVIYNGSGTEAMADLLATAISYMAMLRQLGQPWKIWWVFQWLNRIEYKHFPNRTYRHANVLR